MGSDFFKQTPQQDSNLYFADFVFYPGAYFLYCRVDFGVRPCVRLRPLADYGVAQGEKEQPDGQKKESLQKR